MTEQLERVGEKRGGNEILPSHTERSFNLWRARCRDAVDLRANSVSGFFNAYRGVSMVISSGTEKIPDYGQRRKLPQKSRQKLTFRRKIN